MGIILKSETEASPKERRVLPIAVIALCVIAIGSLVMTVAVFVTFFR